ncbi:MAG: hypothetical protein HZB68_01210 [Candidatus Aenigmarchaeota archaeon]|nr:hypothetical protein [Candidatus Aenigmarchaeota archaeon]
MSLKHIIVTAVSFSLVLPLAMAELEGSYIDTTLHAVTVVFSLALFAVAFLAYRRHERNALIPVTAAFFLFALKHLVEFVFVMTRLISKDFETFAEHSIDLLIMMLFLAYLVKSKVAE